MPPPLRLLLRAVCIDPISQTGGAEKHPRFFARNGTPQAVTIPYVKGVALNAPYLISPRWGKAFVDTGANYGYTIGIKMGVDGVFLLHEKLDGRTGHEVGRELLARLYRQATGADLLEIAVMPQGKPYFPESDWHFSVSHTQNHVFCVLSRKNVGLDAEEIGRKVSQNMMEKFLSEREKSRLGKDPQADFLRLWVLKEALAKLTGRGMGNWMKHTDLDPKDPAIQEIDGCYVAVLEEDYAV